MAADKSKTALFETVPVPKALLTMAVPTILSQLISLFIANAETVRLGTAFMRARCFATPFMFLSFNMVNFMQAVNRGAESFWLPVIRQIALNIPILFLLNALMGMTGIVWTQLTADILNVIISYIVYARVMRQIRQAA